MIAVNKNAAKVVKQEGKAGMPEVFYVDFKGLIRSAVREEVRRAMRPYVLGGIAFLAGLAIAGLAGCATESGKGVDWLSRAKLAENVTMPIGNAGRDIIKQRDTLAADNKVLAERVGELTQGVAQRDATIARQEARLSVAAEQIGTMKTEAAGRDKWDLSGGGFWIAVVAGVSLAGSLVMNVSLLSFLRVVVTQIKHVGTDKWSGAARAIAHGVKVRSRKGIVRRLGGIVGGLVISATGSNAAR